MSTPTSIANISSAMTQLVDDEGWSVLHSSLSGPIRQAAIGKGGIVLGYTSVKGEADYSVGLGLPVHPPVHPELYRDPYLYTVLEALGIDLTNPSEVFLVANENLPLIKGFLSDDAVWERGMEAAIKSMNDKYRRWIDGPEITRKVAQSLAERHPWLATGKTPIPADVRTHELTPSSALSRFRSAIVVAALGLGLLAARCFA